MKTVGIIGAGASGLCAIKNSLAHDLSPIAWEHGSTVGGTWKYSESIGLDSYGYPICSSMYKNMKTNLPKEIMAFPGFPFPDEEDSFVHHTSVQRYLEHYTENYGLKPYINFNNHVSLVEPIFHNEGPPSWKVTAEKLKTGEINTTVCDFLLVCNGHYSKPRETNITGIEKFSGHKLHSHDYRSPIGYDGKMVAVLGAGPSGIDIALELSNVANTVYLCHNLPIPIPSELPDNLLQRKGISEAHNNGFTLKDKSFIEADLLIYCTGYEYYFPFLSKECQIIVENNQVRPLYKHVLHADFPTLGMPGLLYQVLPFPLFDVQIRFLLSIFSGETGVPSSEMMNTEIERSFKRHQYEGNDPRKYFAAFTWQARYTKCLMDYVQQQNLPPFYLKMFTIIALRLLFGYRTLKQYKYRVYSDGTFSETFRGKDTTICLLPVEFIYKMVSLSLTNFTDVFSFLLGFFYKKIKVSIFDLISKFGAWDNYL